MNTYTHIFHTHYSSAQNFAPSPHFTGARSQDSYDVLIAAPMTSLLPFYSILCSSFKDSAPTIPQVFSQSLLIEAYPYSLLQSCINSTASSSDLPYPVLYFLKLYLSPSKLLYCWFSDSSWMDGWLRENRDLASNRPEQCLARRNCSKSL